MPEPAEDAEPPVRVHDLPSTELGAAQRFLDAAEHAAGGPLVDELERVRLTRAVADPTDRARGWQPVLARRAHAVVGYGAVTLPAPDEAIAHGDAAVDRSRPGHLAALLAVLDHLATLAVGRAGAQAQVWVRHVADHELAELASHGIAVVRRLGVLGRTVPPEGPRPPLPPDVAIRPYRTDDDPAVVAVLAAAYAGTPEAGWDLPAFRERRSLPWFRAEDLLLAEDTRDGSLLGLHWLKRRDPATGEVHNLAVRPEAQGRGVGPLLLRAGLDHLADVGCREVLLWVDRDNAPALATYGRAGFVTRWDDVAVRPPAGSARS